MRRWCLTLVMVTACAGASGPSGQGTPTTLVPGVDAPDSAGGRSGWAGGWKHGSAKRHPAPLKGAAPQKSDDKADDTPDRADQPDRTPDEPDTTPARPAPDKPAPPDRPAPDRPPPDRPAPDKPAPDEPDAAAAKSGPTPDRAAAMAKAKQSIVRCFETHKTKGSKVPSVDLSIDPDGAVVDAKVIGTGSDALDRCLAGAYRIMRFPAKGTARHLKVH